MDPSVAHRPLAEFRTMRKVEAALACDLLTLFGLEPEG